LSKYAPALKATKKRDADALCWALIEAALLDLDAGDPPELGKTIIIELIKTVSAATRQSGLAAAYQAQGETVTKRAEMLDEMKSWTGGKSL
jgi:hypothetical protein